MGVVIGEGMCSSISLFIVFCKYEIWRFIKLMNNECHREMNAIIDALLDELFCTLRRDVICRHKQYNDIKRTSNSRYPEGSLPCRCDKYEFTIAKKLSTQKLANSMPDVRFKYILDMHKWYYKTIYSPSYLFFAQHNLEAYSKCCCVFAVSQHTNSFGKPTRQYRDSQVQVQGQAMYAN